jgi:antitoxin ParD1/3/4
MMKEHRMDMAEKLSITLPPEMVRAIKDKVAAGTYTSTSEVIREAVRVWQRQEEEHEERLAAIRARVQRSLADSRPDVPLAEAFDRLGKHHADTMKSR